MTKKSTKRALALSIISLVVCVSMLVGTTFAWFTDSVTSTNNIIKSGNLDVELYFQREGETDWTKVDENTNVFKTDALWEPGYTEVVKLKVVNEGSLALKYQLGVNVFDETGSVNANGTEFKLSDFIKYGIADGGQDYTRETAIAAVDATASLLNAPYESDVIDLPAKNDTDSDEKVVTMVVYMPTAVGNNANHAKDAVVPTIKLGINLFATQFTAEEDSFDNQYDKDAPIAWTGETAMDWYLADPAAAAFEISTAEELAGLAAIVNGTAEGIAQDNFSGQTVKLTTDIDLGNISWDTIGKNHDDEGNDPFSGTFDGQGHTVYNLNIYIEDDKRDSVGFIGSAKNATIKGLTLRNVKINADYFVGAVVGKLSSGEIYDCHVEGDIDITARRNYAAGIVGDGYYNMENCSVIADKTGRITSKAVAGGLCGRINEGTHNIKNCTVKNLDIQSTQQIAAISGFVHYGNTISGCIAENVNLTYTATTGTKPAIGLASGLWYYKDGQPITISDNTFKNITIDAANAVSGTADILYGWEWNDNTTGIIAANNTLENITNNLNYQ